MNELFKQVCLLLISFLLLQSVWFIYDGLTDELNYSSNKPADLALVLGNKIELNGQVSLRLKERLDTALTLYKQNLVKKILVSGAIGKEGFDEALVMKNYLLQKGVEPSDVIEDNKGYNTWASAQNLSDLMKQRSYESVIIVSHYYHIARCKLALQKNGLSKFGTAHAKSPFVLRDLYSVGREIPAYYKYWLLGSNAEKFGY
jgi:vancomycin permeability regulator SanA